jgi:hypothetical protein
MPQCPFKYAVDGVEVECDKPSFHRKDKNVVGFWSHHYNATADVSWLDSEQQGELESMRGAADFVRKFVTTIGGPL